MQSGPKVCIKETSPGVMVPEDLCSAKLPALKGDYNSIYFHAASSDMRLKIDRKASSRSLPYNFSRCKLSLSGNWYIILISCCILDTTDDNTYTGLVLAFNTTTALLDNILYLSVITSTNTSQQDWYWCATAWTREGKLYTEVELSALDCTILKGPFQSQLFFDYQLSLQESVRSPVWGEWELGILVWCKPQHHSLIKHIVEKKCMNNKCIEKA